MRVLMHVFVYYRHSRFSQNEIFHPNFWPLWCSYTVDDWFILFLLRRFLLIRTELVSDNGTKRPRTTGFSMNMVITESNESEREKIKNKKPTDFPYNNTKVLLTS